MAFGTVAIVWERGNILEVLAVVAGADVSGEVLAHPAIKKTIRRTPIMLLLFIVILSIGAGLDNYGCGFKYHSRSLMSRAIGMMLMARTVKSTGPMSSKKVISDMAQKKINAR